MANLLAQTAASGEWYDGWQFVVSAIGAAVEKVSVKCSTKQIPLC